MKTLVQKNCTLSCARPDLHRQKSSASGVRIHRLPITRVKARSRDELPDVPGFEGAGTEIITFMTADGVVKFPGRYGAVRRPGKRASAMPSWEEQKLCIGASFLVAATNGWNPTRRIAIQGFCQSVDLLFESVEDVVMQRGGEILDEQRNLKSGLHEELKLLVVLPFLWGVPPTVDCLKSAITHGGGIVDRVNHRWDMWDLPAYNHQL